MHTSGVLVLKLTGRPEDAVADSVTRWPMVAPSGGVKVMVCGAFPIWKERATVRAGA
jgi:hypothetical protein